MDLRVWKEFFAYEKIVLLSLQSCKLKVFLTSKTKIYTPETEANYLYIILKGSAKNIKVQKIYHLTLLFCRYLLKTYENF